MFEKRPVCNDVYTIKNTQLMKLRNKSIRFGVWFRKLQMLYRVLIDLTITVTEPIPQQSTTKITSQQSIP